MSGKGTSVGFEAWQLRWPEWSASTHLGTTQRAATHPGNSIRDGGPEDIPFLIRNVLLSVAETTISPIFYNTLPRLRLAYQAAKAVMQQSGRSDRTLPEFSFVVVRNDRASTIAAVLVSRSGPASATAICIQYVVVDALERRKQIGRCLTEFLLATAPLGSTVELFCSPAARGMKKIARAAKLKNTERACARGAVILPNHFTLRR